MIVLQLILYCLLFTGMVRYAVRGGAIDGLYFYPKTVQERAIELGLTTQETIKKRNPGWQTSRYSRLRFWVVRKEQNLQS